MLISYNIKDSNPTKLLMLLHMQPNNFYYLYDYNNVNKLRIRNSIRALDSKGRGIIGFKFQIKGRFSRKQKASSVSFRQGLMPLNTISAHIEYAYYVAPIENSAAIVKVWIYRKGCNLTNWLLQIV